MVEQIINCEDYRSADVVILGAPYDNGSSYRRGTARGPVEVVQCLNTQIELFDRFTRQTPARVLKIASHQLGELDELEPERMLDVVRTTYSEMGRYVVLLGGNHSVSIGAFQSIAARRDAGDITILQVDAHLDMRDDDSDYNDVSPSRFAHSCVMRRAHDLGFQIVQAGIRAYADEEYEFVMRNQVPVFEWGRETTPSVEDIMASIRTDDVYLTFDIDGLDPSCAPGTGTPVPGGLSWDYANDLVRSVFRTKNVVGADIVEVIPSPTDPLTPYAAAQLCYSFVGYAFLKPERSFSVSG